MPFVQRSGIGQARSKKRQTVIRADQYNIFVVSARMFERDIIFR